jgi:drug/metabolite transporter (DMT)-like permease
LSASPAGGRPITISAAALALFCAALWGGTSVAIQFTQDHWPPLFTAALRFALGSAFIALWTRWDGQSLSVRRGQWGPIVLVGVLLYLQIGLFHWAHKLTSASHGQVMIGTHPVWVVLLAHFVLPGDRVTWRKVLGLVLATGGVALVVATQQSNLTQINPSTLLGDAVLLVSSVLLAVKTIATKRSLVHVEPGKLLVWSNIVGTALLAATSLAFEDLGTVRYSTSALLGLLYQGAVVAGFCFAVWTVLLRRHRASQLAVFAFAQPLFGILLGVLLRGEAFYAGLAVGGAMVALGILVVTAMEGRRGEMRNSEYGMRSGKSEYEER